MMFTIIRFFSLIVAALLAGTSFGLWMGIDPKQFSPPAFVELQQNLVNALNTLMVSLVVLGTALTLIDGFLNRKHKSTSIYLFFASASFISCILISRFGNTPIQLQMLSWNATTLPSDWTSLRDQWWLLHKIRTINEITALVLICWVSLFKPIR